MTPKSGSDGILFAIGALEQPVASVIPRLSDSQVSSEIPRDRPASPALTIFACPPILRCAASPIKSHRHSKRETFKGSVAELATLLRGNQGFELGFAEV
jgi:hypothetical protein